MTVEDRIDRRIRKRRERILNERLEQAINEQQAKINIFINNVAYYLRQRDFSEALRCFEANYQGNLTITNIERLLEQGFNKKTGETDGFLLDFLDMIDRGDEDNYIAFDSVIDGLLKNKEYGTAHTVIEFYPTKLSDRSISRTKEAYTKR